MLVLSRKVGDKITIGDNITVVVNRVDGNRVSLAIQAPANVRIMRGELAKALAEFHPNVPNDEDHSASPG
jgi:carbon storage regulator